MASITFDTGALIALERGDKRMRVVLKAATLDGVSAVAPSVVIAEWWRGQSKKREDILAAIDVEPTSERLARLAGEALAAVAGSTAVDAIVMASASLRGGVVYTSDFGDLDRLRAFFPAVRVLRA